VILSWLFRRLGFAPAPANIPRASGALGVCQQYPKQPRSKGFADLCTSLGKLLTQMRGMIAEYERAQIAEISEDRSQLPFGERVDLE